MSEKYVKSLNLGNVIEFTKNQKSNKYKYEGSIKIKNLTNQIVLSKLYINDNNKKYITSKNIMILPPEKEGFIKIFTSHNSNKVSNEDHFLIISYPNEEKIEINDIDKANSIFKSKKFKAKGQKLFFIGYNEENEIFEEKGKNDTLLEQIKEIEKKVYLSEEKRNEREKEDNNDNKEPKYYEKTKEKSSSNYNNKLLYIGLGVMLISFGLYFGFRKFKK